MPGKVVDLLLGGDHLTVDGVGNGEVAPVALRDPTDPLFQYAIASSWWSSCWRARTIIEVSRNQV